MDTPSQRGVHHFQHNGTDSDVVLMSPLIDNFLKLSVPRCCCPLTPDGPPLSRTAHHKVIQTRLHLHLETFEPCQTSSLFRLY